MAKKKNSSKYNGETKTSFMFPSLHEDVVDAVSHNMAPPRFYEDNSDRAARQGYPTCVMAKFICKNRACPADGWSSKKVAIVIREYPLNGYNAVVFNQRCKTCDRLGTMVLDEKSYIERVAYRIQKWAGVRLEQQHYGPKKGMPHKSALCEGCTAVLDDQQLVRGWEFEVEVEALDEAFNFVGGLTSGLCGSLGRGDACNKHIDIDGTIHGCISDNPSDASSMTSHPQVDRPWTAAASLPDHTFSFNVSNSQRGANQPPVKHQGIRERMMEEWVGFPPSIETITTARDRYEIRGDVVLGVMVHWEERQMVCIELGWCVLSLGEQGKRFKDFIMYSWDDIEMRTHPSNPSRFTFQHETRASNIYYF